MVHNPPVEGCCAGTRAALAAIAPTRWLTERDTNTSAWPLYSYTPQSGGRGACVDARG